MKFIGTGIQKGTATDGKPEICNIYEIFVN